MNLMYSKTKLDDIGSPGFSNCLTPSLICARFVGIYGWQLKAWLPITTETA